jgi:putative endonuclease
MHYCYILRCADGSFYVGVAEDPERRCREYNQGKGAVWTARRFPVEVVWTEAHDSLSSARTPENQLKRWSHAKKAALVGDSLRLRSGQA